MIVIVKYCVLSSNSRRSSSSSTKIRNVFTCNRVAYQILSEIVSKKIFVVTIPGFVFIVCTAFNEIQIKFQLFSRKNRNFEFTNRNVRDE